MASQAFALTLFRNAVGAGNTNVFLSPVSLSLAMTMALNGASDQTLHEMAKALDVKVEELEQTNKQHKELVGQLTGSKEVTLHLANSFWYHTTFGFRPDFISTVQSHYAAHISPLTTHEPINHWCSQATHGKIQKVLEQLSPLDKAVLVNAVYFKGLFESKFNPAQTRDADFHLSSGAVAPCKLMHQKRKYPFFSNERYQSVLLHYGQSKEFAATVILPDKSIPINEFVKTFTDEERRSTHFKDVEVNLYLPKFKVEWKKDVKEELSQLGMQRAFSVKEAEFRKMADNPAGLYISSVVHSTFVEVNEEGTEAAAVTAVKVTTRCMVHLAPEMRVDRPFLFLLQHIPTDTVLFLGKIESV